MPRAVSTADSCSIEPSTPCSQPASYPATYLLQDQLLWVWLLHQRWDVEGWRLHLHSCRQLLHKRHMVHSHRAPRPYRLQRQARIRHACSCRCLRPQQWHARHLQLRHAVHVAAAAPLELLLRRRLLVLPLVLMLLAVRRGPGPWHKDAARAGLERARLSGAPLEGCRVLGGLRIPCQGHMTPLEIQLGSGRTAWACDAGTQQAVRQEVSAVSGPTSSLADAAGCRRHAPSDAHPCQPRGRRPAIRCHPAAIAAACRAVVVASPAAPHSSC